MKKLGWLALFFFTKSVFAFDFNSNMSTNLVNTSSLIWVSSSTPGDILWNVTIDSRAASAETVNIYDSSATATNMIANIDLSSSAVSNGWNQYIYNHRVSSGITVSKSGSSANVHLFWRKVR